MMTKVEPVLEEGGQQVVEIAGEKVLYCRSGGNTYAIGPICPHQGASLLGGKLRGKTISCPLHGGRFDMATGRALGSQYPPITVYDLEKLEQGVVAPKA
jgi:3-phenylpropionate/trans-cinnamate dioxygenase ferredoxin subunit